MGPDVCPGVSRDLTVCQLGITKAAVGAGPELTIIVEYDSSAAVGIPALGEMECIPETSFGTSFPESSFPGTGEVFLYLEFPSPCEVISTMK